MFRSILLISSTVFWLAMMSQLVHREYFQIHTAETAYEVIPITTTPIREDYRGIYLGSQRIGFDYHGFERIKDKPGNDHNQYEFELRHSAYMSFLLLGYRNEMLIRGMAWLDEQFNLKEFKMWIQGANTKTTIKGKAIPGKLEVRIQDNDSPEVLQTLDAPEAVLHSEAIENIWTESNLRVGKRGRFKVFNALTMTIEDLEFRVDRKETLRHGDKDTPVFVVTLGDGIYQTQSWITAQGVTLKKETPSGLVLISEPGWEIFDAMRKQLESPPDLPSLYSIESNITLKDPRTLKKLELRLKTPSVNQVITFDRENLNDIPTTPLASIDSAQYQEFLKSTPYIQSESEAIREQAKKLVQGQANALEASLVIMRWVHQEMIPYPTMSVPSAEQVLKLKKGDCNEYTVLFTALARAAGIPAKMIAGLVYQNGRFFYHAWPAVFVGRWISLDPTFNQAPVDVSHIPLTEGDLESQVHLADKIGQIQVEILSYQ